MSTRSIPPDGPAGERMSSSSAHNDATFVDARRSLERSPGGRGQECRRTISAPYRRQGLPLSSGFIEFSNGTDRDAGIVYVQSYRFAGLRCRPKLHPAVWVTAISSAGVGALYRFLIVDQLARRVDTMSARGLATKQSRTSDCSGDPRSLDEVDREITRVDRVPPLGSESLAESAIGASTRSQLPYPH